MSEQPLSSSKPSVGEHSEPPFGRDMLISSIAKAIQCCVLRDTPSGLVLNGPVAYVCIPATALQIGYTIRIEATRPACQDADQLYWSQDFETWTRKQHKPKAEKRASGPRKEAKAKREKREIL